ncbi:hypothetical protein OBA28_00410 [Alphaproteobacteria bacterium]|nr:hypothetical protein [Alphaproteobacteria bacterium]
METGSFIHAAIPVDIAKKMKLENNTKVIAIFPAATVIILFKKTDSSYFCQTLVKY